MVLLPILDIPVLAVELVVVIQALQVAVEMEAMVVVMVQETAVGMVLGVVAQPVTAVMAEMVGIQLHPPLVPVAMAPVAVAAVEQEAWI
jgi:hypothetical protein